MDVERLIQRAQEGDLEAFAEVTRRFQHMAFGYAVALLRDLQQAEDVVQEAFVAAWFGLRSLADPAAFPGWLRGIVRHQGYRVLRQRPQAPLPLEAAFGVPANGSTPDRRAEEREQVAALLGAIAGLPNPVREVVTLFYVHDLHPAGHRHVPEPPGDDGEQSPARGQTAAQAGDTDHGQGHARSASPARRLRGPDRTDRANP